MQAQDRAPDDRDQQGQRQDHEQRDHGLFPARRLGGVFGFGAEPELVDGADFGVVAVRQQGRGFVDQGFALGGVEPGFQGVGGAVAQYAGEQGQAVLFAAYDVDAEMAGTAAGDTHDAAQPGFVVGFAAWFDQVFDDQGDDFVGACLGCWVHGVSLLLRDISDEGSLPEGGWGKLDVRAVWKLLD